MENNSFPDKQLWNEHDYLYDYSSMNFLIYLPLFEGQLSISVILVLFIYYNSIYFELAFIC